MPARARVIQPPEIPRSRMRMKSNLSDTNTIDRPTVRPTDSLRTNATKHQKHKITKIAHVQMRTCVRAFAHIKPTWGARI